MSSRVSNLGGTLLTAVVVGGVVFVGYEVGQCYMKTGSLSPVSLIGCFVGDTADEIQRQGDKVQCAAGLGKAPQFPTSPLSFIPKAFGAIGDSVTTGKNFAKAVQDRGMMIDCSKK